MSLWGVSEASRATPEIQMIANKVRPQLEAKTNKKYEKFEAVEYKTQVDAGENIFIKMDVGHGCFIHIKVFNGPTGKDNYELHGYQTDKTMDEELTYFGGSGGGGSGSAIAAMNEPKTCSTTALKKYVLENHPGANSNYQMRLLKKTLQKCEKNGWLEQISGKGFSGTFQLSFPYGSSLGGGGSGSLWGVSEASRATPEIQMIANKVRPQLEAKTNKKYEKFEAVEYKTQVDAGENIFIKMDVGHGCFIHIKVFNGPTGKDNYELHGYQTDKTMDEELTYFGGSGGGGSSGGLKGPDIYKGVYQFKSVEFDSGSLGGGGSGSLWGVSEASRATPEIQMIANKVRPQLEAKTNKKYEKFEAVEYKTQVDAGENIFIKMDVGHGCFIHIKVFNGPTGKDNYELHGYQTDKTMDEELTYFGSSGSGGSSGDYKDDDDKSGLGS